jgi:hypothetical protein
VGTVPPPPVEVGVQIYNTKYGADKDDHPFCGSVICVRQASRLVSTSLTTLECCGVPVISPCGYGAIARLMTATVEPVWTCLPQCPVARSRIL